MGAGEARRAGGVSGRRKDRPLIPGDRLIPAAIRARGRAAIIRSRAILVVVAVGAVACAVSAYLDFRAGTRLVGWFTLAFGAAALAVPVVLYRAGSLLLAGNLLAGVIFLTIFVPGLLTLGRGAAAMFLFLVPVFAVLFCGRRAGAAWALVAGVGVLALGALAASTWEAPVELAAVPMRTSRAALLSLVAATLCLLTYDAVKEAALADVERANSELRRSREELRDLIETSPDAVFVTDGDRIVYANSRGMALLGAAEEASIVGRAGLDFVEILPETLAGFWRDIAAGERVERVQMSLRRLDGSLVPVETNAIPTRFEGAPAILYVVRDRSEEARTLARLQLLGTVVDQGHEGVLVVDAEGTIRYANEGFARSRGISVEEMIGRPVMELPRDDATRGFVRGLAGPLRDAEGTLGGRFRFDGPLGRRSWDIRIFPVDVGDPRGPMSVTLLRDVSRETELEESARQSQKMEAVGQLAGGIAHDFNNHLTVILGHVEELRAALPADSPQRAAVDAIVAAVDRSAALTQQLLAFASRQAVDVQLLDLGEVVSGMRDMLRRLLPERIALSMELGDGVPAVLADRGQLEQVVLNLLLNARDAIEGAGRIRVETRSGPLGEDLGQPSPGGAPAELAILRVTDDGAGMDEAVRSRIFEPFFTTKPAGRGTGLGLATVHGIVHQSHGTIAVESAPGRGTSVSVYLPAAEPARAVRGEEPKREAPVPQRAGRVLLVEDDAPVRRLGRRALEAAGFEVAEAEGGEEALRLAAERRPDVVVTDLVMPGLSGLELADRLGARHPGVPVLFVSGYAEEAAENRLALGAGRELLGKPFRPQQLVDHVRRLLAGHGAR